ncbi:MAG: protein kinase, partial [Ruminiclostridium sp.]
MSQIIASTYELIEEIGSGGGGIVYLANHLRLNKKVVLKADKRKISTRPEILRREVDIMKDLSHSYIPKVYDFFVEDDTVYTVIDFIEGESLDKKLKRGERIPQPEVVKWAKQLLSALVYMHSPIHGNPPRGFVHSDIKPANIMVTSFNDVCLIDFNIALAIGETNVIGCSAGYASPEHYGLDYSLESEYYTDNDATVRLSPEESLSSSGSSGRKIIPDVRSDIYSLGATLYHLLSGRRPDRDARLVTPLTEKETSPCLCKIISKAMCPNPDLRYQTAAEMLEDFERLYENDHRTKRYKRKYAVLFSAAGVLIAVGLFSSFVGLKRMENNENRLKLAEYSKSALAKGDVYKAVDMAKEAAEESSGLLSCVPPPEAQRALSNALMVYDLSDGFKPSFTVTLPSAPFGIEISPDGAKAAFIYSGNILLYDLMQHKEIAVLPIADSALCEAEFVDNDRLVYAGDSGITAYDIKNGKVLWTGEPATAICISADKSTAACVFKDGNTAYVYDITSGNLKGQADFGEKGQSVAVNDSFANPGGCLFALNEKGTKLAVSFSDGS